MYIYAILCFENTRLLCRLHVYATTEDTIKSFIKLMKENLYLEIYFNIERKIKLPWRPQLKSCLDYILQEFIITHELKNCKYDILSVWYSYKNILAELIYIGFLSWFYAAMSGYCVAAVMRCPWSVLIVQGVYKWACPVHLMDMLNDYSKC